MPARINPRLRLLYTAVLLLLLSGCGVNPATPAPPTVPAVFTPPAAGQVLIGTWGDGEISLTTDSSGGALFFTCALGRFPPLRVDAQGRFDVPGTYLDKPGFPQPTPPAPIPARYQGQVIGSTMVLTLTRFYPPPRTYTYQLPFDPTYTPPSPCA